jgi:hypothetical protein
MKRAARADGPRTAIAGDYLYIHRSLERPLRAERGKRAMAAKISASTSRAVSVGRPEAFRFRSGNRSRLARR